MHRRVLPRPLDGSLRDILGRGLVAGGGQCHAEDDPPEPAHERDREAGVAAGRVNQQDLIGLLR